MNDMNGWRSDVLCDDILGLIFKRLDIKDLFALQVVSKQFRDCSQQVLKNRSELSVGFTELKATSKIKCFKHNFEAEDWKRIDITPAISLNGFDLSMDYNRYQRVETIVRQFRAVKKLYLSKTVISFKTMEIFVNQFPQLENLYIYEILISDLSEHTITEWTQLLSKVKQIVIGRIATKYMRFVRDLIARLPSLQAVNVWGLMLECLSDPTISLSSLTDCLSANIQCLHIGVTSADNQALDVITTKCQQISKLSIYESCSLQLIDDPLNLWNQWFALVCHRLKGLTYLKIILGDIPAKEFAESIAKLQELKTLDISSGHDQIGDPFEEIPRMCFDVQEMSKYMPPMVSLKTISLHRLRCSPNRWSQFAKFFPNVSRITIDYMYCCFDCTHGEECNECFYRCMDFVSKLPTLRQVHIFDPINGRITRHILALFADVDRLSVGSVFQPNDDMIEELIHFTVFSLDNRRRELRLDLKLSLKKDLIQRMAQMDVRMNGCVVLGNFFTLQYLRL